MAEEKNKKIKKEFGLTNMAVDNRMTVLILGFIIVMFGLSSYERMPKESFPEIVMPEMYINTFYEGNSPVDIENLITRHIEKELESLSGIKKIQSTSLQDYSVIVVTFNPDVTKEQALQDVKDAVDQAKNELPDDLRQDPTVMEVNLSEMPIMFINMSGDYTDKQLKDYGEYLEEEIEKLGEISEVRVKGIGEREIQVNVDVVKMEAMGVSFMEIWQAIDKENMSASGGSIKTGEFRRSVRVVGEFTDPQQIEEIIVKAKGGNVVYLKDVADIADTDKERDSYSRSGLKPVVTLDVVKRSGENLLNAADQIKEIIETAREKGKLPPADELEIILTNDQSRQVRTMVADLINSIISGVILVVGVLLFFMGVRSALFVGVAIPMSMFISFILLSSFGVTMNIMVLFSLILALGMLVDNGIVVIENIYRLMEEGYPLKRAIKEGVGEIAIPIIASTATTVAAFLPLAFWKSLMGEFMKFLPITLIVVLSSSLFVALVINPALAMFFAKLDDYDKPVPKRLVIAAVVLIILALPLYFVMPDFVLANVLMLAGGLTLINVFLLTPAIKWFQNVFLPFLENVYNKTIGFALRGRRPYLIFFGTFGLLILSFVLIGVAAPKTSLFPNNEPNYVNIFIQKPIGTDIEATNEFTRKIEKDLQQILKPYDDIVEAVIAQVGKNTNDPNEGPSPGVTPHKARIAVSFVKFQDRHGRNSNEVLELVRKEMKKYSGAQITVSKESAGPPVGPPINIEISGEDYEKLINLAGNVKKFIQDANVQGIEKLKSDLEDGNPELLVSIDRDQARKLGVSTEMIANELRIALFGLEISKYKEGEDDYPIMLRLDEAQRYNLKSLENKKISAGEGKQIPIKSLAEFDYTSSFGSVKRKDLKKVISLFSNVKEGYNANEIVEELKSLMETYDIPVGYDVKFTGEQEEQKETTEYLGFAFTIALFMVFLIIVSQFNSIWAPVVIMLSVIFSLIGVFLGLVIFQMDFIILMTGIGIISLAGVVVNNAIVLIDYTNLLRNRRKEELGIDQDDRLPVAEFAKCIQEAGKKRLRPVLLTAITTVLGLIPLAVGLNIDFYGLFASFQPNIFFGGENTAFFGPMAWAVIFGLIFGTFLTLVVVPVMYLIQYQLSELILGLFGKKAELPPPTPAEELATTV